MGLLFPSSSPSPKQRLWQVPPCGFLFPTRRQVLTNAEKLGIHAVEVGHEEEAHGS